MSNSPPTSQQTNSKPTKDSKENSSKPKKQAVVQDENQFVQNINKGRLVPNIIYQYLIFTIYKINSTIIVLLLWTYWAVTPFGLVLLSVLIEYSVDRYISKVLQSRTCVKVTINV